MRFGQIDSLLLFGGGPRLINFISMAQGYQVYVVSAPRLLGAKLSEHNCTVEEYFKANQVSFVSVENLDEFDLGAHLTETTLGISFGAPWIFRKLFIAQFKGRLINGHGAPLPKYRGAATFSWQIMRSDHTGCHLFHLVDEGVDTGPIIMARPFVFPVDCRTPKEYQDFYRAKELDFFNVFFQKLKVNEEFNEIKQEETQSTYFPRLSTLRHGFINWSWTADDLARFICAFDAPYEGAATFINGEKVFLHGATVDLFEGAFHPFMSGLVYRKIAGYIYIAAQGGSVIVKEVCDEQGNNFFEKVRLGSRFVTPTRYLDEALEFKAVYDARGLKISSKS